MGWASRVLPLRVLPLLSCCGRSVAAAAALLPLLCCRCSPAAAAAVVVLPPLLRLLPQRQRLVLCVLPSRTAKQRKLQG